ncbi:hypothetical protein TYRP_012331 [Tyrophagus putrescentiae]|nr:hypothetical protein TYRP_012331 [Tyrophagus putrescentiae]
MNFSAFSDDCLLAVFSELPLSYRLRTVPLVCRRWAGLQPLVRRAATEVTLLSGDSSKVNHFLLMSPFCLVDRRTIVTETPDLLHLSTSVDTATDVVERLQTELPNIRRLSIVQVNDLHSNALQPELLSAVEAFAGQLTSFALHFLFKSFFYKSKLYLVVKQPVISANSNRLLSFINYKMPQLRHLILNTDQSFFFNDMPNNSEKDYKMLAPGSLYLPVLRRLHTFSFKSPYHADILHYSLRKFVPGNNHLKVRLAHLPFSDYNEKSTPEKLWKDEVVISHVDYLHAINFFPNDQLKLCHLANIKYFHLYNYFTPHGPESLLPLFTTLSSSFPKLTTFSLQLMSPREFVPENLPPLPRVTNLTLNWEFDDGCGFRAIFQPSRVFPALRQLTIVPDRCAKHCPFHSHEYDLSTIQQALKPLKLYPRGALQHISINFCKRICQGKRLVLTIEDFELPLSYRLRTVPLVCRRWAGLQPLVRRAVTEVTLLRGNNSNAYHSLLMSPFCLVDRRTLLTEAPDLLQLSTSSSADTATDVVERLQTELPNIRRLTIVQVNDLHSSALQPELLSAVEAFAGQLTSFALHFQFKRIGPDQFMFQVPVNQPVISANFHCLLSLINYKMPQLRHLLLNTDHSFFYNDSVGNNSLRGYKMLARGSLYLPVLRRLHTFSFKSPYHADILYYSLLKFASENNHLKVRLAHLPFSHYNEEFTPEKLWKDEVVISHVDYLYATDFLPNDQLKLCHLANIKYLHLYNYWTPRGPESLLPLFTTLASSFSKLTTFSLHLISPMNVVPADLPPLPRVTNLTLNWELDDGCSFGAIFQPSRVFPALRQLTIVPDRCAKHCPFHSHEYDLSTIQQALKPLKLYPRGALQHISINFCKRICQGKRLVLTIEDFELPLSYRLRTVPLVCRRWAGLQPMVQRAVTEVTLLRGDSSDAYHSLLMSPGGKCTCVFITLVSLLTSTHSSEDQTSLLNNTTLLVRYDVKKLHNSRQTLTRDSQGTRRVLDDTGGRRLLTVGLFSLRWTSFLTELQLSTTELALLLELPLSYRLRTVPLVCRRWAGLQPLVRRAVTSVTLLRGNSSNVYHSRLMSPFCLVDKRTNVTEAPDLLQFSTLADTAADVVERLQTELPNIRRLSIVHLNDRHSSALQPELLSAVEAFAGQLTSFALYFQFKWVGPDQFMFQTAVNQPVISANFHRLLSLINYKMPQLRHLLLNTDQSFFYNDSVDNNYLRAYKVLARGSLYLPVLRRLHTFSFKSYYHADILYYSLRKFASENNHLKVRLAHLPFSHYNEESTPEKLWKDEVVISHVDYLYAFNFFPNDQLKLCHLANIKYLYLYKYFTPRGPESLLPLFTTLSRSFLKLTTFSLYLMYPREFMPEDLPPLPRVTNLTLNWELDNGCGFRAIFQPSRVFPALRQLTIVPDRCAKHCPFTHMTPHHPSTTPHPPHHPITPSPHHPSPPHHPSHHHPITPHPITPPHHPSTPAPHHPSHPITHHPSPPLPSHPSHHPITPSPHHPITPSPITTPSPHHPSPHSHYPIMNFSSFSDDCLLAVFSELPLSYRLRTVPLVCRRWAGLQPMVQRAVTEVTLLRGDSSDAYHSLLMSPGGKCTCVFITLVSLLTSTHSSEDQSINTKLFYIKF